MSDDGAPAVEEKKKRGRPSKGTNDVKETKSESKKRGKDKKEVKPKSGSASGDEDGPQPAKRGRGRPKGSTKKRSPTKAKVNDENLIHTYRF